MTPKRARVDTVLVSQGHFASREQAQRAVMAGLVKLGDRVVNKSSVLVTTDASLLVAAPPKYVGRGGLKLEGALDQFGVDPAAGPPSTLGPPPVGLRIASCSVAPRGFTPLMSGMGRSRGKSGAILAS